MTDRQRDEIRKMRLNGLGYNMIAGLLNLGENNVYAYCKSHGLAGASDLVKLNYPIWCQQNGRCPVCDAKLVQPKTGRYKKFCSGRCRTKAYRIKQEIQNTEE